MTHISRREFGAMLAAGAIGARLGAPSMAWRMVAAPDTARVTAAEVLDRIRRTIGVEWRADTVDTIKAGDPSTLVTGVVTTALASMAVLRQAVGAGANLVITCEPTFFGHADARQSRPGDPVYAAKNAFLDAHRLVVVRLSEHWRRRTPDPFATGLAAVLGWGREGSFGATPSGSAPNTRPSLPPAVAPNAMPNVPLDAPHYDVPPVALDALARDVKRRLGGRGGIRVIGDPHTRVRRVALLPGSTPLAAALQALPAADAVVAGEVREWESAEYARDVATSTRAKGLITVGRVVSEEPGMAECARWLTPLVPEVPVRHLSAGDPYWSPA